MNLDLFFKRVFADWQKFLMVGLGAFLINMVAGLIGVILMAALLGPSIFAAIRADVMGYGMDPAALFTMIGSMIGVALLSVVMAILAGGLSQAGLMGSLAGYRRGEQVTLGSFWNYATLYFGKMILLGVVFALIMIVSLIMLIIPILGWIAFFIWVPTAVVVIAIYPAYLIVTRGFSVGDAIGRGFRVLTSMFGEALLSGLIVIGFSVAFGLISVVPLVGWLVGALFLQPIMTYFFVERFETEVAPKLGI